MIWIVEIPHQLPPMVWSRRTWDEIFAACEENNERSGRTIYEKTDGATLKAMYGEDEQDEWTLALLTAHGEQTPLYRADYMRGWVEGEYYAREITEKDAYIAYLEHDLSSCLIYESDEEACAAVEAGIPGHQGWKATAHLRRALENAGVLNVNEDAE